MTRLSHKLENFDYVEVQSPKILEPGSGLYQHAYLKDAATIIKKPTVLTHRGVPIAAYGLLQPKETAELRRACFDIRFGNSTRAQGMKQRSQTFGFQPRVAFATDYCRVSSLNREHPAAHAAFVRFAATADRLFQDRMSMEAAGQKRWLDENVHKDWRLATSDYFTSGIVNHTTNLTYHRDKGNVPGGYSVMTVLKQGIQGGELILPEFNLGFECADNSYLVFIGQSWLHGVAPIMVDFAGAYRYSIVYYAMNNLKFGLPLAEENKRIMRIRTERERAKLDPGHMARVMAGRKRTEQEDDE